MSTAKLCNGLDTATPLNLQKRIRLITPYLDAKSRVLDVGSGRGDYAAAISELVRSVHGIEVMEEKVLAARKMGRDYILQGTGENLPFPSASFDFVLLNEVLEHVDDHNKALHEIHRVLIPGGKLAVFCPNRLFPFEGHGVKFRTRHFGPSKTFLFPYLPAALHKPMRLEASARNYWPWELASLIAKNGFLVERIEFVTQTLEGKGNEQISQTTVAMARRVLSTCGRIPLVRAFVSVSSLVIAQKRSSDAGS